MSRRDGADTHSQRLPSALRHLCPATTPCLEGTTALLQRLPGAPHPLWSAMTPGLDGAAERPLRLTTALLQLRPATTPRAWMEPPHSRSASLVPLIGFARPTTSDRTHRLRPSGTTLGTHPTPFQRHQGSCHCPSYVPSVPPPFALVWSSARRTVWHMLGEEEERIFTALLASAILIQLSPSDIASADGHGL